MSRCEARGSYPVEALPHGVREALLKRGELLVIEPSEELSRLLGLEHLEDYQYLRIVLRRD